MRNDISYETPKPSLILKKCSDMLYIKNIIRLFLYITMLLSTFIMISYGRIFYDSIYVNIFWVFGLPLTSRLASHDDLQWRDLPDVVACIITAAIVVISTVWISDCEYVKSSMIWYVQDIGFSGAAILFLVSVFIVFCILIEFRGTVKIYSDNS